MNQDCEGGRTYKLFNPVPVVKCGNPATVRVENRNGVSGRGRCWRTYHVCEVHGAQFYRDHSRDAYTLPDGSRYRQIVREI